MSHWEAIYIFPTPAAYIQIINFIINRKCIQYPQKFWTPQGQIFFNRTVNTFFKCTANTCRRRYLFSHFIPLVLVDFILHWCWWFTNGEDLYHRKTMLHWSCQKCNCYFLLFKLKDKQSLLLVFVSSDRSSLRDDALDIRYKIDFFRCTPALHNHFTSEYQCY